MLEETSAETSERVIAVLGPRLEAISRLVVGLHSEPAIRGDRRVRSKLEAAQCLDEVIATAVPDTQVGPDNSLDVAVHRAQVYAAETAQAAAERELAKEAFRRENEAAVTSSTMKELAETRRQLKISKEIAARYRHDAETMNAVVECGVAERTNIVRCGYPPKPQQPPSRVGACLACAEGGPLAVRPFRDSGCLALADTG
ncbi:unnamed protein product [Phytophthora fragariaefolia]|uniref:Unnamed protein product n=1 Tax=Phytophthora fragariaefolia TaxID=1490495 RepID=A0A9W7D6T1_9STRA|nr:unnamed protein product [Phytophthora fragariaefolia]